jgi:SAM-dependent methyltransferase
MTNSQTILAYEEHVQEYFNSSPQKVDGGLKDWIEQGLARITKDAKILEIGTATGKDADYIESIGYSVIRSDATKAFVEMQKNNGHEAKVINLLTDDIGKPYDLIFANAVLLHFNEEELNASLQKVYDALAEDGYFMFTLKIGDGEETTTQKLNAARYFHYWHEADIRPKLEAIGFVNTEVRVWDDYRSNKPAWLCVTTQKGNR